MASEFRQGLFPSCMLVKLNKNGEIVYKVPLSNKAMGFDQIFGIHIKDGKTYVVGISRYIDDYLVNYPCEQILPTEKNPNVFCVYTVCIDSDGKELDRKIFKYDILNNTTYCDSVLLPNGYLVISGSASPYGNTFNLDFPQDVDRIASLYIFKEL